MGIRLFHGSKSGIEGEIAPRSRTDCDFGKGFYLGDSPAQPMTLICHYEHPEFYTCELDLAGLRTFDFTSRYEWALYIALSRGKLDSIATTDLYARIAKLGENVDVMIGKIANDRMFTAQVYKNFRREGLYFDEFLDKFASGDLPCS